MNEAAVRRLHGDAFDVALLERQDILATEPRFRERGITALHECAYALVRRAGHPAQ